MNRNVADLLVECLEAEGVEYVFGLPGEETIPLMDALEKSRIRFVLVRHEQGAAFMADIYGRLTGRAGVCAATLGPGAINLLLGVADAQTDSTPLVALSAQVGLNRIYKESHQIVDLVSMFKPVTKWSDMVMTAPSVPEMIRKAFDLAETERPGAVYLAVPQDMEQVEIPDHIQPLTARPVHRSAPDPAQVAAAADLICAAAHPVILAGHGVARARASDALVAFAERLGLPVATTFMAKGVISDRHPQSLGTIGFMQHDYENFAFDQADVIVSIGYELQEFPPTRINPRLDKKIVHLHSFAEDMDGAYQIAVNIEAHIALTLEALTAEVLCRHPRFTLETTIRTLIGEELRNGEGDAAFPVKPQRLVADIRKAMGDEDIVLADTGAVKMWMARLYPSYAPLTCLISNGLSSMGFALPGAIAAKLACPERKVLAVTGDGGFLMNSQEMETAVREMVPLVVLVWVDGAYGLTKWKMDLRAGSQGKVEFTNPDFVTYARSFGARGYAVERADDLLPALQDALARDGVSLIACPVDYRENMKLTEKLGALAIDP